MSPDTDKLQERLGYRFQQPELLQAALTHRSMGGANNERLEFLGDGLLNFVIAEALFRLRPRCNEGELSRLRANLVNRGSLALISRDLGLGEWMRLGGGELKSGGHRRESILADAVEAIVGAVYLDGGFEAAVALLHRLYAARLADLPDVESLKDPKTRLQEYLQAGGKPLPEYELLQITGKAHEQSFRVACRLQGHDFYGEGRSGSRRKAEQAAAEHMLQLLKGKS
ncbi:ribonuclease III [Alkalilimnicola sp. S0819]|uniref:ribonuclease III n=1 Tax=Alkalilimnicola sp. S0819 TaxID=2613922 RepID=UPI001261DFDF|nr:ribonuclease III [Alkalilimnicola sp. S0819]KAB7627559.1 ribonuclease III [Alkalilimnicola sp. S0819]MPQ15716.1 ribonuclease III [Alkalilimnicola sp. S0819]